MGFAELKDTVAAALAALPARRRWVLAVSGGVDSRLLLALVARLAAEGRALPALVAHVDHGLHPDAPAWAARVVAAAAAAGLPCRVLQARVVDTGEGLEAAARHARRAALAGLLLPGDALLLAHQADDQAETLLLRLLRGSGLAGLAAMRPVTAFPGVDDVLVARPLLAATRAQVEAAAREAGLDWVEDPANADRRHDRNFLRHEVLPPLARRWPAAVPVLARSAAHLGEADALLGELLDGQLATLLQAGGALDAAGLLRPSLPLRRALLRRWLAGLGAPMPPAARLASMLAVAAARADAAGEVRWGGWELHRHAGRLHAFPALAPADPSRTLAWDLRGGLDLGPGCGRLEARPGPGPAAGLALAPGTPVTVVFRRGGERIATAAGHRPLKKLLQEAGIPPWWRARLPLVCRGAELVAVADLHVAPGCAGDAVHLAWTGRPPGGP